MLVKENDKQLFKSLIKPKIYLNDFMVHYNKMEYR